ncbi:MAG: amino acid transporter [Acidobacteria bacterium RIFCSPLOWO2_02_FULL_67_36]|nr:MAG: amino acid transporter [Acidobacteria bacterium RIFCSPLOWO2_02_FULL_67_36]OFW22794.1 MAG: amino acid transporter [Acidobacteria bacterium RIFCSPLOWO2_12_FULL_66_21]
MLTDRQRRRLKLWFYQGLRETEGPYAQHVHQSAWWKVMCLTGVDYFSTLGYQPGIAFLAAGFLSPLATLVLILLTLFGALPIYRRVAESSPHGHGSIAMLEELLPRWRGKAFVLCLLGFAATDFVITITLSAADATAHIVGNPLVPHALNYPIALTLVLLTLLAAVFLKGFKEAINIAVTIVAVYLLLNVVVIGWGLQEIITHPFHIPEWRRGLLEQHGSIPAMIAVALLVFPKLALGLSGFETGVAVMPLVKGDPGDDPERPAGRIRNTRKLLSSAAFIMSAFLLGSSIVTTLLIPPAEFQRGGEASGRALSYLAHTHISQMFGTVYDISTISILWFAGASAMAGLLNLVPRYLPRYGMAPEWTRATRPLVLLFTGITFFITWWFKADVEAQGGAYATGVLMLMTSAAVAVTLSVASRRRQLYAFSGITLVFVYTTITNVVERPEGIKIAFWFILTIIVTSLVSRVYRSTELRVQAVETDQRASRFIAEAGERTVRILTHRPNTGQAAEYEHKLREASDAHHLPPDEPVLFLEISPSDVSEFRGHLKVTGADVHGYRVLRCESPAVPNAIAALLLHIRNQTGKIPHAYFGWTEGNPIAYLLKFLAFGEGDTAPVTREVLRQSEPSPTRRPRIHVG